MFMFFSIDFRHILKKSMVNLKIVSGIIYSLQTKKKKLNMKNFKEMAYL